MSTTKTIIALDLGATWIRGAVFDESLKVLRESRVASRDSIQGKADPNFLRSKELASNLAAWVKEQGLSLVAGCIAVPEYVDSSGNITSEEQISWSIQPSKLLEEATGIPWFTESDVRCAAIAETSRFKDFLYVTVSSGISHCLVIKGEPLTGAFGRAIGLGTMKASDGLLTVEEIASGLGIARRYHALTGSELNAEEITARYASDEVARKIIDEASSELALALNHASMILDPGRIIMGGGFWLGSELLRKLTIQRFEALMNGNILPELSDATSENSGLRGVGISAWRLLHAVPKSD
jgi:glucokinase